MDLIVLGYQHYRASGVAEHVIRALPHCSILLARPPEPAPSSVGGRKPDM